MPSFSRNLEETLHRAVDFANQRKHEYATLEHLLLSLADDEYSILTREMSAVHANASAWHAAGQAPPSHLASHVRVAA